MIDILAGIALGLLAHQTERITRRMPDGWRPLTNYGIGYLGIYPFFCWLFKRTPQSATPDERARIAYILSGVFFGLGVGIAYVIDALRRTK
jgi:uncharacterized membrane-anchored protein YitT (DUF2179 family)